MRTRSWILTFVVVLVCGLTDTQVTCQGGTQFSQKPAAPYGGLYSLFVKEHEELEELPETVVFVSVRVLRL